MTVNEAASLLKVHARVLARKLKAGDIPGQKTGGAWDIAPDTVDRLLASRHELDPEFLSVAQVASKLRKGPETVREFIRAGELPAQRDPLSHGGKLFVKKSDLAPMKRALSELPKRGPKH